MKKSIYTIALVTLLVAACSEDFIEIQPISTVDVNAVYKTDKDFQDAVLGCYSSLRDQYQNYWQFGDLRGDDSEAQMFKSNTSDYINNFTVDNTAGILNSSWQNYYILINRANTVLKNIEGANPEVVKNKDRYIGEVKFLRAMAYFDLVRIFGAVPAITKILTEEEAYKTVRTSAATIYDEIIIPDLLDAESKLPPAYATADVGRATQGAVKAMLGRVYLTRQDFPNAELKLHEVTQMGYKLLDNYKDLFDYSKNEHHSEYIFDVEYEEQLGIGSIFTHDFAPRIPALLTSYGILGQGGDNQNANAGLIALFTADDERKDVTVATGYTNSNGVYVPLPPNQVQSYTRKYVTPVAIQSNSKANWKVIRYADVLLMYAEALNENGKTTEALDYLNEVRTRAGVTTYEDLSKEDTREKIYLERRLELSFEGHRWFDLVRTGRALTEMEPFGMKPYMTVFPIPLNQIQVINNPDVLGQNEGYE